MCIAAIERTPRMKKQNRRMALAIAGFGARMALAIASRAGRMRSIAGQHAHLILILQKNRRIYLHLVCMCMSVSLGQRMTVFNVEQQDGQRILRIEGALMLHEVEEITESLCRTVERIPASSLLVIDLSKVPQIDTTGTGLLSLVKRISERRKITIKLAQCSPENQHVIDRFLWLDTPVKKQKSIADMNCCN